MIDHEAMKQFSTMLDIPIDKTDVCPRCNYDMTYNEDEEFECENCNYPEAPPQISFKYTELEL